MSESEIFKFWVPKPAVQINSELNKLPVATEVGIKRDDTGKKEKRAKLIYVGDELVSTPSNKYKLIQHKEAFRPIIEGLTVSGVKDFEFDTWNTSAYACLKILVGEADDGVKYGFRVTNSFNGTSSVKFDYNSYRKQNVVEYVEKEHVILWGYRQVCSNGMKIKVPLKTVKYIDAVERTKITKLLEGRKKVKHSGNSVKDKIQELQYVVELMLLLKKPLNRMIIDAQKFKVKPKDVEELLVKYVGKRKHDRYLEKFNEERGNDLWTLYNSLTWFASHATDITIRQRETMMEKASNMLTKVLVEQ